MPRKPPANGHASKTLGPEVPRPTLPGIPLSAQQLEDLRRTAFRTHLECVHLGQVADPQPPIARSQMGASCPSCGKVIALFVGYNLTFSARFEDPSVDVKFVCAGSAIEPHAPIEISMRAFHAAQQDTLRVMTAAN